MTMQKATIVTVAVVVVIGLMVSALGALVATHTISNSGSVTAVGVGVYADNGCTTVLSTVSWGTVDPGAVQTYTMYVRNEGNVPVTLNMAEDSWNPGPASSYVTLTWNQENDVLPVGQIVQALLTLTVSSSANSGASFSFDIIITGTQ